LTWFGAGHGFIRQTGLIKACLIHDAEFPARVPGKIFWWTTLKKRPPAPITSEHYQTDRLFTNGVIMNAEKKKRPIRVLIAKPGLDGHDRGAKVVAHALRDAGMEVIYTGLHQSVDSIVQAAMQEDVDVIGLSIMSGAHLPICKKLIGLLKEKGIQDKLVAVGGVIPKKDIPTLKKLGVAGVFPGGTPFSVPVAFIRANLP
jgi:methylmalonyl-CoA mutase cobalamin-binding domain/chain